MTPKSSAGELRRRGMAAREEIAALEGLPTEARARMLREGEPWARTAAAASFSPARGEDAELLLDQLAREKCLYTRLAICESLAGGDRGTAERLAARLGTIGGNQHRALPPRPSAKGSFPLPRDLAARTLGRMDPSVFPVLLEVLGKGDLMALREALDAVGYMAWRCPEVAVEPAAERVLWVMDRHGGDPVLVWKGALCLSAFPVEAGIRRLEELAARPGVLGAEARRSLAVVRRREERLNGR